MNKRPILLLLLLLLAFTTNAQNEKPLIRPVINILTAPAMHGRGYVKDGVKLASYFLQRKFKSCLLRPVTKDGTFIQGYSFSVNTFPGKMMLGINKKELKPGADYLIDASSVSYSGQDMKVKTIDLTKVTDKARLRKTLSSFEDGSYAYCLEGVDSCCKVLKIPPGKFSSLLPKGLYIIPQEAKLTWTVEQDTIAATVFYVKKDALQGPIKTVSADVEALWIPKDNNENIMACVPGMVKDTFIAFTAHYDHLGMMGDSTYFPGASDNASGTAMMLYLAYYFSFHPQRYSILFIAFSGEEPGLLGSQYYVAHPVVPLANIKFLTNIDIMGDATDGVTVVNATEYPRQFSQLQQINDAHHYIPVIKSRGKAANSDHYYFSEAGVPSFFIYSNGGKGYYHDIYDKGDAVTLDNVDGVAKLLVDFITGLN